MTVPATDGVNDTPSSTEEVSLDAATAGVSVPSNVDTVDMLESSVVNDQVWVASFTPSVVAIPETLAVTCALFGSCALGVNVIVCPSVDRVVVPEMVMPGLVTETAYPLAMLVDNRMLMVEPRSTPTAPGTGDWLTTVSDACELLKTTSTR